MTGPPRVPTIGLTGGIGSGKSTAAAILRDLGAAVVDADRIGHEIYAPGTEGWRAVVDAFGAGIVAANGEIDRAALGARVFSDPDALARLNDIVHPRIARETADRLAALRASGVPAVVLEAALLVETGGHAAVDEVWVVATSPERAVERVVRSRGVSAEDARRRIASQTTNATRLAAADVVLANDGSPEDLRAQVVRAWRERISPGPAAPG